MLARDRFTWLFAAAGWLWSSQAFAETFSTTIHGPENCSDRQAFESEILVRTQAAMAGESGAYVFDVRVHDRKGKIDGTLTVRRHGQLISTRRLDGDTCAEVTSALALIAALTLDPKARSEPLDVLRRQSTKVSRGAPTPADPAGSEPPNNTGQNSSAISVPGATEVHREHAPNPAPPAPRDVVTTDRQKKAQSSPPMQRPIRATRIPAILFGVELAWLSPIAPRGAFWGAAVVETRLVQGPLFRLALGAMAPTERANSGGESARYSYVGGQLDVGWQWIKNRNFGLDTGLNAAFGDLSVQAVEAGRVSRSARSHAAFVAVGPALSIARLWSSIETSVVVSMPIALNRPEFEIYVPEREVFSTTPILGVKFALIVAFGLGNERPRADTDKP